MFFLVFFSGPSFLSKLDRAMQSEFLSERTLMLQIGALRMETLK